MQHGSNNESHRTDAFLFHNGPIYPMDGPRLDRGVVMTRGRTIAYAGPPDGLDPAVGRRATEVDLASRPLLPGFCDCHVHLLLGALTFQGLDLHGVNSIAELQALLTAGAGTTPVGDWIVGHGWEKHRLDVGQRPAMDVLDAVTTEHPMFLASKDLHSAWFNSAGLQRVDALGELPGKCVLHRVRGVPSGLVLEDIFLLREALLPPPDDAAKARALRAYIRHLWSRGITAVHSMETAGDLALIERNLASSTERVRVLGNLVFESPDELRRGAAEFRRALPDWLCTGGAKLFLDGSFGTLTAAVSHPYTGTDDRGILGMERAELSAWLDAVADVGVPAVIHAIGDRAIELALSELRRRSWPPGIRHRLEHAQLLSRRIISDFDLRGLVFSSQPSHMWADREIVERHLQDVNGRRWAYAHETMTRQGGLLVFGSDAPVEDVDPWKGIQAAVTRLCTADRPPWIESERIGLLDALAAHTSRPALLHDHGFRTGRIAPGCLADLVVLNQDPFDLSEATAGGPWGEMRTDMTFLGGELVYRREQSRR